MHDPSSAHYLRTSSGTMLLKRILYYLNPATLFSKAEASGNVRFMHGINRISILLFLGCLLVLLLRTLLR